MGMMTRRNVKQRAVKKSAPVVKKNQDNFSVDGKVIGKIKNDVVDITDEKLIKENQFTKTGINRMSTAELKEIAKLNEVKDAENMTGGELKRVLIDKFGL